LIGLLLWQPVYVTDGDSARHYVPALRFLGWLLTTPVLVAHAHGLPLGMANKSPQRTLLALVAVRGAAKPCSIILEEPALQTQACAQTLPS
jgi:bacteriorhodopsin